MIARDLMTPNPITVDVDDSLRDALELLVNNDIRELPVLEEGALVGIITDRDLKMVLGPPARALDERKLDETNQRLPVRRWMTEEVECVFDTDDIAEICRTFGALRVGALPVVDADHRLVGIISVTDILAMAADLFEGT